MSIIDMKLIDAYTILTLSKSDMSLSISEMMDIVKVPIKYKQDVEIKVAEKIINVLGGEMDGV